MRVYRWLFSERCRKGDVESYKLTSAPSINLMQRQSDVNIKKTKQNAQLAHTHTHTQAETVIAMSQKSISSMLSCLGSHYTRG